MTVEARSVETIEQDLATAEQQFVETAPARLQQRITSLQDELAEARNLAAADNARAAKQQAEDRVAQLWTVLDALKVERSHAVMTAGTHRTVANVAKAFELDGQVVACASDLALLLGDRPESQIGVSTVKTDLAELRQTPAFRGFFYRNPTERRPPVDRSRWARFVPTAAS